MKGIVLALFALLIVGCLGNTGNLFGSTGGGDVGGDAGADARECDDSSCATIWSSGLAVQGEAVCDAAVASAYSAVVNCACDPSTCEDACGKDLCSDLGASAPCSTCVAQACAAALTACMKD